MDMSSFPGVRRMRTMASPKPLLSDYTAGDGRRLVKQAWVREANPTHAGSATDVLLGRCGGGRVERLQVTKSVLSNDDRKMCPEMPRGCSGIFNAATPGRIRKSLYDFRMRRELVSSACFNCYFVACFVGLRKLQSVEWLNFSRGEGGAGKAEEDMGVSAGGKRETMT
ncbi:hypothetical protein BDZ85DRAFT_16004 [Elsinoe ampelina]|uniref:Uncharacterized protein n=1 Tax=Elsinoe ampelina TaxID=302913 RepID=A0A6A6G6V0_9PEZI|nr:hypothetical protein BDZ85DRAFT_16004 [Elsinoe ampelina]